VSYTTTTGNTLSARCQGWDEDEALRQLQLMLVDLALDSSQVLAVTRVDEPELATGSGPGSFLETRSRMTQHSLWLRFPRPHGPD